MTKRSDIRGVRADTYREEAPPLNVIRGGWDPDEAYERSGKRRQRGAETQPVSTANGREQSYVKNVQPRSEGQARLMDAIEHGQPPGAEWLQAVGREDGLFPTLNAADWATLPAAAG